jgi:hypothetical protein
MLNFQKEKSFEATEEERKNVKIQFWTWKKYFF